MEKTDHLRMVLCAYHRQDDAQELKHLLEQNGFDTEFSKRYMIFIHDPDLAPPYLRRGVIRAIKEV